MKSITVTTHRAINYGAVLQAYALHKTQLSLGIDNELLDFPIRNKMFEEVNFPFKRNDFINIILNSLTVLNLKKAKRLQKGFQRFVKNRIKTTEQVYDSNEKLQADYPKADFYISGSDQVLGLRSEALERNAYMLQFGPDNMARYTYAASLGEYDWDEQEKNTAAEILGKYNKISVREKYCKEYLEEFSDINCSVNIDPVFLLTKEQWSEIAVKPSMQGDYILCYHLLSNKNTQAVLDALKEKYHLPVVCLQTNFFRHIKADRFVFDASPEEFVGWIKNAAAVVTTSFHGTAFSGIFEKPFYTLTKNYKSQRMTDLLEMFKLSDRIIKDTDEVKNISTEIDFTVCREQISAERERSINYLKSIIAKLSNK